MKRTRRLLAFFAIVALALGAATASARPGGGSSFRGSSSRSSSGSSGRSGSGFGSTSYGGSGGSGAGLFELLLFLHPSFGIPLVLFMIVFVIMRARAGQNAVDWNTIPSRDSRDLGPPPRSILEGLSRLDPNFSIVVFEDFVYALYTEVHAARGRGQIGNLSSYLSPAAEQSFAALTASTAPIAEVRTVVIGAMRIVDARVPATPNDAVRTTIEIESNYTEVNKQGALQAFYTCEQWSLVRRAGTVSRTPQNARVIACPNCGAPLDGVVAGTCRYCKKDVCTGGFDWLVQAVRVVSREARGPMLTEETPEEGTNLPTIADRNAIRSLQAAAARDEAFAWPTIERRLGEIFNQFQRAWAGRDLASMRPLMSETLFQTQTYWITTYLQQGLKNVTENARIEQLELARVSTDKFFDAVTVRLFASSLDYTVSDKDGRVVCGSRKKPRAYSEYWTLIRGRAQSSGSGATDGKACPNCGAPVSVNMAGACTYCKATVSSGQFEWVLSRIEQDEVYSG